MRSNAAPIPIENYGKLKEVSYLEIIYSQIAQQMINSLIVIVIAQQLRAVNNNVHKLKWMTLYHSTGMWNEYVVTIVQQLSNLQHKCSEFHS